jgi:hypothetical protein
MMMAAVGMFFCEAMMMMAFLSCSGNLISQVASVFTNRKMKCRTMAAKAAAAPRGTGSAGQTWSMR